MHKAIIKIKDKLEFFFNIFINKLSKIIMINQLIDNGKILTSFIDKQILEYY